MEAKQLKDVPIKKNMRGIAARLLVDHDYATVKELILEANQSIPTHQVDVDVLFFILEGSGTIKKNDKTYDVSKGFFLHCPINTPMSVTASEDGLSFLNIKTPGFNPSK